MILDFKEEEMVSIITQIKEVKKREIVDVKDQKLGDENTIYVDDYDIKMIDPVFIVLESPSYKSGSLGSGETTTPLGLNITGCICYNEKGDEVELSASDNERITRALRIVFTVKDYTIQ